MKAAGVALAAVLVLLALLAISVGLWVFGVLSSNVHGAGEAIKQKNNVTNRIEKQEMFEQLNADIDGYVAKIRSFGPATSPYDRTNLQGLRQTCIDTVQHYNAEARKYTSRDFRSVDLPPQRDPEECR